MAEIEGVDTKRNMNGDVTHLTIDLEKHREAIPVLQQLGLLEKSDFDIDFEEGIPLEVSRQTTLDMVRELFKEK